MYVKIFGIPRDMATASLGEPLTAASATVVDRHLMGENGRSNLIVRVSDLDLLKRALHTWNPQLFKKVRTEVQKDYKTPNRRGKVVHVQCHVPRPRDLPVNHPFPEIETDFFQAALEHCISAFALCGIVLTCYKPESKSVSLFLETADTIADSVCNPEKPFFDAEPLGFRVGHSHYTAYLHTLQVSKKSARIYGGIELAAASGVPPPPPLAEADADADELFGYPAQSTPSDCYFDVVPPAQHNAAAPTTWCHEPYPGV